MDEERENRLMPLGGALAISLERIAKMQEALPVDERNHPLPSLHIVRSPPQTVEQPITKVELARLLSPLEVVYGSRRMDEAETTAKYQLYYAVLGHLPEKRVRMAVERFCKSTDPVYDYFPKPALLLKLAKV